MKIIIISLALLLTSLIASAENKLLVIGDSISEGYGVAKENAYPTLLEKKILESGKKWTVVNASISGSTTASALSRLKWQIKSKPQILILALGANDGLRGLKTDETKNNLAQTIELAQKEHIQVVLAGMQAPPNYGKDYTNKFKSIFTSLALQYKLRTIPFLLEKVAGVSNFNQADGIHPNEKGHEIVANTVYNSIKDLL